MSKGADKIQKHPDLWLPHGNIAIVAEKTAFRMPSSLLSGVSEVFRDMFEFPPESTTSEMYEGIPLIILYDSAEDVAMLFDALTQGFRLPRRDLRATAYARAVFRLSNKYIIQIFRPMLEQYFSENYPLSLADYDRRISIDQEYMRIRHLRGLMVLEPNQTNYDLPIRQNWPYDFAMDIITAREVGLDAILPSAFYGLYVSMTGDARLNNASSWLKGLSLEDTQRVIQGQIILGTKSISIYTIPSSDHLVSSQGICQTWSVCLAEVEKWRAINEKKPYERSLSTPLYMLQALGAAAEQIDGSTHPICFMCKKALKMSYEKRRLEIWDQIPEIFDLVKPKQTWDSVNWDIPYVSG